MSTNALRSSEINRSWIKIDAKNQVLGRLSTQIASLLIGKSKPNYVPYLDNGDFVVVVNSNKIKLTGKKDLQKVYVRHSGFPGGLKKTNYAKQLDVDSTRIIMHAVSGMLPKNKLGRQMIKKLHVYPDTNHPYKLKLKD